MHSLIRQFIWNVHAMHPDEKLIRSAEKVENDRHKKECETHFSEESYEFPDANGETWKQWICWCGLGTYVEKVKENG